MCGTGVDLFLCSHQEASQGSLFSQVGYLSLTGVSLGLHRGCWLWSLSLIPHPNLSLLPLQLDSTSLHPGHVGGAA